MVVWPSRMRCPHSACLLAQCSHRYGSRSSPLGTTNSRASCQQCSHVPISWSFTLPSLRLRAWRRWARPGWLAIGAPGKSAAYHRACTSSETARAMSRTHDGIRHSAASPFPPFAALLQPVDELRDVLRQVPPSGSDVLDEHSQRLHNLAPQRLHLPLTSRQR